MAQVEKIDLLHISHHDDVFYLQKAPVCLPGYQAAG